jgi:hypothetical protein
VTGTEILGSAVNDIASSAILLQLALVGVSVIVIGFARALAGAHEFAPGRSGSITRDFDLARALDLELAHALARPLNLDLTSELARVLELARALALARGLARARDLARAIELAHEIVHEIDIDPTRKFDPIPELDRELDRALGLDRALDIDALDIDILSTRDVRYAGIGRALSDAFSGVLNHVDAARRESKDVQPLQAADALAQDLVGSAGISDDYETTVTLDAIADTVREASATFSGEASDTPWADTVAQRLEEAVVPVFTRHQRLTPANATRIRLAALALAGEAESSGLAEAGEKFRAIAAAVTLLERRAAGQSPLETLILARA